MGVFTPRRWTGGTWARHRCEGHEDSVTNSERGPFDDGGISFASIAVYARMLLSMLADAVGLVLRPICS